MIPIGRPFMDYALSGLADAGYAEACLVIGPEHQIVRNYYQPKIRPSASASISPFKKNL